ncbi:MAG: HINT domain-containing protein [Ruminococcus flavefaciens]|nr:HINT domain-containing protein [Ruminococcus flavefaciens]
MLIENYYIELAEESILVYNFQVEDFHTYFVGDCGVWVHNANGYRYNNDPMQDPKAVRQTRLEYHLENEAKLQNMYDQGMTLQQIAESMVNGRNINRINSYLIYK